jgi:tRNA-dihydrouridine synthase
MIGRGAIRNPWLFQQIRDATEGRPVYQPTLRDLRAYVDRLYAETRVPHLNEAANIAKLKKTMNFVGQGIGPDEAFLHIIRRAATEREFFGACDEFLNNDEPFADEPPARALTCKRSEAIPYR